MLKLLATLLLAFSIFFNVKAQDFILDSTFASDGTYFNTNLRAFDACTIQSDGKTLVIGQVRDNNSFFLYSILSRLNSDGSPDMSFGSGGMITNNQLEFYASPENIVLQNDGKILVCGQVNTSNISMMAIARFNTNGNLDFTFGTNGLKMMNITPGYPEWVGSAVIQADGKIILAGGVATGDPYYYTNNSYDFALVRLLSNGDIDNTFGNSGIVTTDFDNDKNIAQSIKLYPDGSILVVGENNSSTGFCAVAKYDSNGNLDLTFNSSGKVTINFPFDGIYSVFIPIIQSDGKILISREITNNYMGEYAFGIIRLNTNGTLDNSYGTNGLFSTNFSPMKRDFSRSMVLQNDGKVIVVGNSETSNPGYLSILAVAKVTTNGMLDLNFDSDGLDTLAYGNMDASGYDVAIDNDGRIIIAGYNENQAFISRFILSDQPAEIKEEKLAFSISPNPTSESVTITSSKEIIKSIILTNSSGEIIKQFEINKLSIDVNLKDLPDGIYFVKIETNSGRVSQKIIKN